MMTLNEFLTTKGLDNALSDKYYQFMRLTLDWNEKINVTAVKDEEEFIQKNIIDSLTIVGRSELSNAGRIIDVGTGGGLPGIPLAIAYPEKEFILMDAIGKKLKVVEAVASELGLKNLKTVHARAEDLARQKDFREAFDLAVSRAVANMTTLSEYCLPFVKVGGNFTAFKTENAAEEIAAAANAVVKLGGLLHEFKGDGLEGSGHGFVRIEKVGRTPKAYPRKAGLPSKEPLV